MGVGETPLLVRGHQNLEKFLHSGLVECFCGLRHTPICPHRLASITSPVRELSLRTTLELGV